MSTYDNAPPPDGWRPTPRDPGAFERLMARSLAELPEATWSKPGDLSRMSIESMARSAAFEAAELEIPPNIVLGVE